MQPQVDSSPIPTHYHIGVKPTRLHPNTYNLSLLSYTQHFHLLINHGEELLQFNSKTRELISSTPGQGQGQVQGQGIAHERAGYRKSTYSQKWKCIFLLDANQKLSVFSFDNLLPLARDIDIKSIRHCLDFMYLDQYSTFVVLTPESLLIVYVEINSNHLKSLFTNAYKFKMKEVEVKVLSKGYFLGFASRIWKMGQYLVLNNSQSVKIIWHAHDRNFNQRESEQDTKLGLLSQGLFQLALGSLPSTSKYSKRTIIHLTRICSPPEQITNLLYNPEQYILVCGTNQGNLKVYKINTKNIIATTSPSLKMEDICIEARTQLAFKLGLHNGRPITSIQMYSPRIILSIGLDQYLEVVSFDQMSSIEKFRSASALTNINFVTNNLFLGVKAIGFDQFLYSYEISLDYELLVQHNSQILRSMIKKDLGIFVLSDNSVNVVKLGQGRRKGRNGDGMIRQKSISKGDKKIKQIQSQPQTQIRKQSEQQGSLLPKQSFVPPRCKSILAIQSYPYTKKKSSQSSISSHEQFWILTDQSQIYRYIFTSHPTPTLTTPTPNFHIAGLHDLHTFTDTYNHETKEKVCTMKFIDIVPVYYDSDIKEKKYEPNYAEVDEVKPIAFGCLTGELLVCSSQQPKKIIARVRCFGEPVTAITSCLHPQDSTHSNRDRGRQQTHTRRVIIYSSIRQIIAVKLSNHEIPVIVYKLLLHDTPFTLKQLSPHFTSILNGNIPKLLTPSPSLLPSTTTPTPTPKQSLQLWTPTLPLHTSPITCLEHCRGLTMVSGDSNGKIVLWNLRSEILAIIEIVSEEVGLEVCGVWGDVLMFGYGGKLFELGLDRNREFWGGELEKQKIEDIVTDQEWVMQYTTQLAASTNPNTILQYFSHNPHHHHSYSNQQVHSFHSLEMSSDKHKKSPRHERQRTIEIGGQVKILDRERSIENYVENMKKTLVKITHEMESKNPDTITPFSLQPENKSQKKKSPNPNRKPKTNKSHSTYKYKPNPYNNHNTKKIQEQLEESRISRARSILNKFKQSQTLDETTPYTTETYIGHKNGNSDNNSNSNRNDISLPQIRNTSTNLKVGQKIIGNVEGQIDNNDSNNNAKKNKNRNKKYEFLFHFPNEGFYAQLLSKNMLQ